MKLFLLAITAITLSACSSTRADLTELINTTARGMGKTAGSFMTPPPE